MTDYKVIKAVRNGCEYNLPEPKNGIVVDALIVAGGGGGGGALNAIGSGGGAGGVIKLENYKLDGGYIINVGCGGNGGISGAGIQVGCNGQNSSIGKCVAYGGGGGASTNNCFSCYGDIAYVSGPGQPGGSGGGFSVKTYCEACRFTYNPQIFSARGVEGQGNDGGTWFGCQGSYGGNGGGAGGRAYLGVASYAGYCPGIPFAGPGIMSDIDGTNKCYAGGGAGGSDGLKQLGNYGGGDGATCTLNATAATTCGSGGGGGARGGTRCGCKGGDGIVIIRYPTECGYCLEGGCKYTCGNYTIHCYTSDGILYQPQPGKKMFKYLAVGGGGGGAGYCQDTYRRYGGGGGGGDVIEGLYQGNDTEFNITIGTGGNGGIGSGTGGTSTCIGCLIEAKGGCGSPGHSGGASGNGHKGGVMKCSGGGGGGGGGAGTNGADDWNGIAGGSGLGGDGLQSSISGTKRRYGGGGHGGSGNACGCYSCGGGGRNSYCNCYSCNATYYGGGGGGTGLGSYCGGKGCQGIAIISYKTDGTDGITCATGGTVTTCGDYTIHTFTSNGTFCIVS